MPLRSYSLAELTLTERRRLERPLLVMIWLGVFSFSLAEGNLFYMVAGTVAVTVNLLAASRGKEVYVRRIFVNIGVVLATGVLLLELPGEQPQLVILSHYLVLIQLCKLFEQKRNRDYVQMLAMSLLLVMVATLLSDALWLAAAALTYVVLACHAAMVFTLKRGLDGAASARLATEPSPPPVQRIAWNVVRDWPQRPLRGAVGLCLTAILASGVAIFLLAPRQPGAGLALAALGMRPAATSGFSPAVELGRTSQVYLSDRIVMRVRLSEDSKPVVGLGAAAYLRGQTFDQYAKSRWSAAGGASAGPRERTQAQAPAPPAGALMQEVSMVPRLLPAVFGCYPVVSLDGGDRLVRYDSDLNYTMLRRAAETEEEGPVRYTCYSFPQRLSEAQRRQVAATRAAPAGLLFWQASYGPPVGALAALTGRDSSLSWGLMTPVGSVTVRPPVAELARQWCQDLVDARQREALRRDELDLEIASRLVQRLQERCTYSLDLRDADPARDGVEDFLFHLKRGHCEYFASALAVMCRSLGVRARLATGFHLGVGSLAGEHIVRERDAHAWVEVYTPGTDWIAFDCSPNGEMGAQEGWWGGLRDLWQTIQFQWYETVTGYDATTRDRLLRWFSGLFSAVGRWARQVLASAGEALWEGFKNLVIHGYVDKAVFIFAVAIASGGLLVEAMLILRTLLRLRRSPWLQKELAVPAWQLSFVARLFRALERHGLRPHPGQTALGCAQEAARQFGLPGQPLEELVQLYYRLRWGGLPANSAEIQAAEAKVAQLERALARRAPAADSGRRAGREQ